MILRPLLIVQPRIVSPLTSLSLALVLSAGCSSTKPPPNPPLAVAQAAHQSAQAERLFLQQNWSAAAEAWEDAATRFQLLNDLPNEARAWHNLAQAQRELGQLSSALSNLERAALINETAGQSRAWWRDQIALLQAEALMGNRDRLEERFPKLLAELDRVEDREIAGLFLNEVGLWQQQQDKFSEAAESFRLAQEHFQATQYRLGQATVQANRARLFEVEKDYPAAIANWRGSLTLFQALGHESGIASTLAGWGRVLLTTGDDLAQAETLLRRAAENYRILHRPEAARRTLDLLNQALRAQGKPAEENR